MSGEIKVTGIVLKSLPVGDYDRSLSIITCEKGKISAYAKNSRRPMSNLRVISMPFTYGRFSIYAGRDSYSINYCEDAVHFDGLSSDLEKTSTAMYFCELISFFTRENSEEREQVKLLYTAFKVLQDGKLPYDFVRRVFELRCLANYGEAPNIFECSACNRKTESDLWLFNVRQGTIKCRYCANINENSRPTGQDELVIPETVRYAMHYTVTAPYKTLFGFRLVPEMEKQFAGTVDRCIKNHVDKPLKTLELLDSLMYNET